MKRFVLSIVLAAVIAWATVYAAEKKVSGVPEKAKCPVCCMFVSKYPDWTATARLKDGTTQYFDGPKDLFTFYLDPAGFTAGKRQADIAALAVREYYSLEPIDPRSAFFVVGSDVYGPMGSELIPFKTEKDAASFKADHKGKRIVRFNEITKQVIKTLN